MPTISDFNQAVERLLGKQMYKNLVNSGYTPHHFCREIAQLEFIDALNESETKEPDLLLIRSVAKNLWAGDGVTGLAH